VAAMSFAKVSADLEDRGQWNPDTPLPGSWTPESGASGGWTPQAAKSGGWIKEDVA
jgi:hypothetical protein